MIGNHRKRVEKLGRKHAFLTHECGALAARFAEIEKEYSALEEKESVVGLNADESARKDALKRESDEMLPKIARLQQISNVTKEQAKQLDLEINGEK